MPDANDPRGRAPAGWGDAFAAMPLEAPASDAWPHIAARLDARAATVAPPVASSATATLPVAAKRHAGRRRNARAAGWLGAAAAAALALVVAWPRPEIVPAAATTPPAPAQAQAQAQAQAPTPTPTPDATLAAADRKPAGDAAIALPKAVQASRKPRYAARQAPARIAAPALDALYAESARLETLLALARDDRVASAAAALLSAELDAQVAGIDVRLAQPGLDDAQRRTLWQARVDALRQAAGFESTQRVLASQGDGGALLVSVD
jgi:hypothetical protein